jgi:hypothetical protein
MTENDLDAEIDQLAAEVEETIQTTQEVLDDCPDFQPRNRGNYLQWGQAQP